MSERRPVQATVASLRESHLFDGIHDAVLARLASELPSELAMPGDLVITEAELAAHMFVVINGEVEVVHKGSGDHDVRVALLGPGDWVGEMAILGLQPRSASVRALAPTTLVRLSTADARRLIQEESPLEYAQLVANIARELARRLRVADHIIAHASSQLAQRYVMESRRPPAG